MGVSEADLQLHSGALLASVPAHTTIESCNASLRPHGLCLPIAPLVPGRTLAELVADNAGGRRSLRYGTIAHYLRAATLHTPDGPLPLGGATLKRATGYRLAHALVGQNHAPPDTADLLAPLAAHVQTLTAITVRLHPLPPARRVVLLVAPTLPHACQYALSLLAQGLSLSALWVATEADADPTALLLVEIEGHTDSVQAQIDRLSTLAHQHHLAITDVRDESADHPTPNWHHWERRAALWQDLTPAHRLRLTLPRTALPHITSRAQQIAHRYRLTAHIWGDLGTGRLFLHLAPATTTAPPTDSEIAQAVAIIREEAKQPDGAASQHRSITAPLPSHPAAPLERLRDVVGAPYLLTRPEEVGGYAADASIASAEGDPLAVVLPASTAEVSQIMQIAADAAIPIVTRGAGSGLAGGSTPTPGALVLALTRMQRLTIDPHQMTAHAEAGVMTADLQRAAEAHNLFYPPDPSSQNVSTIGGNIACNAGGPRCIKYGVTADYVPGLTAVLADGHILRVGNGVNHHAPDASLLHLLIGSEGTLAVITEATMRLIAAPPAHRTVLALFDRLESACTTVEAIMAAGLLPAALELMDDTTIAVVDDYLHLGLPRDAGALLLLLSDGEPEAVEAESHQLAEFARRGGARHVTLAHTPHDEAALWRGRRAIGPALARVRPNRLGEDICVPVHQIAATVARIKAIATHYNLPIPVFGHAGDGNLHPNILFDARDAAQVTQAWHAAEAIFTAALDVGGTLSGEHGIGTLKRAFLPAALGEQNLALHRAIKATFDPHHRLNPGKVLV